MQIQSQALITQYTRYQLMFLLELLEMSLRVGVQGQMERGKA